MLKHMVMYFTCDMRCTMYGMWVVVCGMRYVIIIQFSIGHDVACYDWCGSLCYAVLCYAVLCCAMLCCAMLCHAMPWDAVICHDVQHSTPRTSTDRRPGPRGWFDGKVPCQPFSAKTLARRRDHCHEMEILSRF